MFTEVFEYEDVLDCFTRLHQFKKKHRAFFYKKGPLIQGHKIGCPRLEHLLNLTLRYGYSLWYDVIFVDNINQCVRLGVMGRENPQTFFVQFKKMHTLWSIDSKEN